MHTNTHTHTQKKGPCSLHPPHLLERFSQPMVLLLLVHHHYVRLVSHHQFVFLYLARSFSPTLGNVSHFDLQAILGICSGDWMGHSSSFILGSLPFWNIHPCFIFIADFYQECLVFCYSFLFICLSIIWSVPVQYDVPTSKHCRYGVVMFHRLQFWSPLTRLYCLSISQVCLIAFLANVKNTSTCFFFFDKGVLHGELAYKPCWLRVLLIVFFETIACAHSMSFCSSLQVALDSWRTLLINLFTPLSEILWHTWSSTPGLW